MNRSNGSNARIGSRSGELRAATTVADAMRVARPASRAGSPLWSRPAASIFST